MVSTRSARPVGTSESRGPTRWMLSMASAMGELCIYSIAAGVITIPFTALMKKGKLFKAATEKVVLAGGA
ncbi:hypothetical protein PG995_014066 [Apiospora arundinis]